MIIIYALCKHNKLRALVVSLSTKCYPPILHQQAPMGRACLTAGRQQVDQTCDRVVPTRPQMAYGSSKKMLVG